MAYKKPGAYARFIKKTGAIGNVGSTRVMALVGTGTSIKNLPLFATIEREDEDREMLPDFNIAKVLEVFIPVSETNLEKKVFKEGEHYEVFVKPNASDANLTETYIVWKETIITPGSPERVELIEGKDNSPASIILLRDRAIVTISDPVVLQDKTWILEVIDPGVSGVGQFKIFEKGSNPATAPILTNSSTTPNTTIPGVDIILDDTSEYLVGDSIEIKVFKEVVEVKGYAGPLETEKYNVLYYNYKTKEDYEPKVFYDYDSVIAEYDNYLISSVTGNVTNSLTLGAEVAFMNGCSSLVCVQVPEDDLYGFKAAIDKLKYNIEEIDRISTLVVLSVDPDIVSLATNHVKIASSADISKECMTYISGDKNLTIKQILQTVKGISEDNEINYRTVYIAPTVVEKRVKDLESNRIKTFRLPGCYLAAAIGAISTRFDVAEPLTNKSIDGFSRLGTKYLESEMNLLASKGCLVVRQTGTTLMIRHGITTSGNDIDDTEITTVQIRDEITYICRDILGKNFIGKKLLPSVLSDINITINNILKSLEKDQIILSASDVVVKRSTIDPRQVDVRFEVEAVYPLNYVNIEFSFSGVN